MILQALNRYYERQAAREDSKIAPPGYSYEKISFALVLSATGDVVDIEDLRSVEGKRLEPNLLLVPQPPKKAGIKPPPAFLWDKTGYVFGIERGTSPEQLLVENPEYRASFQTYHHDLLVGCDDASIRALLAFLDRWSPSQFGTLRHSSELADTNVVFRLDGDDLFIHQRGVAQDIWARAQASATGPLRQCLVSGEIEPMARLHASIRGVKGAQPAGASIVSFEKLSFRSYGKTQGDNAPVSEAATFAYTTALNELLRRGSKQRIQIGDATVVFWAEADESAVAESAELAMQFLSAPSQDYLDRRETARIASEVMESFEKGRPLENPELGLFPGTRFYVLGLSPNAARLSVRFWHMTTFGELGAAFHRHWHDLLLIPDRNPLPPSIFRLCMVTCRGSTDENRRITYDWRPDNPSKPPKFSPLLSGELMRAILTQGRYPASLLASLVMRIRSDHVIDHTRASLIKAILVRTLRLEGRLPKEDYLVRTDPDDPNEARRLGRLFAVLERAQAAALGSGINTTIKDKYLGAAAATPARVFPGLIKTAVHHTSRLRKGHTDASWVKKPAAAGFALERDIGQLTARFTDGFPAQHSIEDQGLFLVGYYQERFAGIPDPDIGDDVIMTTENIDNSDHNDD